MVGRHPRTVQRQEHTWALSECLLIDGERLIVTPGGADALMAALDKRTGETVWTTPPLEGDRVSHSSPILFRWAGKRIIANCSSAHGFGVDAETGKLLWTAPLNNPHGVNVSTPIYGSGCVFFMTPYSEHGRLYRLGTNPQGMTAEHRWTSPVDGVTSCGVLASDTLFVSGYRDVKWWLGVDWRTGETKYEMKDLAIGAPIYADGRLYVLDEQGTAALLKPGADQLEVVGRFPLTPSRDRDAWSHPVLLDGRLYFRYHDTLRCLDIIDEEQGS
jgi:outer membrane protein assembly factor BamB